VARRFTRGRVVSGTRRMTQWVSSPDETAFTTLAVATNSISSSLVPSDQPETVVRTRGHIVCQSDQEASDEAPFGALGIIIVSAEALAAGAAAIPPPYSNAGDDGFFVHQYWHCPIVFSTGTGLANLSQTFTFDSKAMRKLSPDDRIVVMVENGSATFAVSFLLSFRMLLKAS